VAVPVGGGGGAVGEECRHGACQGEQLEKLYDALELPQCCRGLLLSAVSYYGDVMIEVVGET
jgi:hypothetical protein